MFKITYTKLAGKDLDRIWTACFEARGQDFAHQFVNRITIGLERMLREFPYAGRARSEYGFEVRTYPVLQYRIYYRVMKRTVKVLHIRHGSRDSRPGVVSFLPAAALADGLRAA